MDSLVLPSSNSGRTRIIKRRLVIRGVTAAALITWANANLILNSSQNSGGRKCEKRRMSTSQAVAGGSQVKRPNESNEKFEGTVVPKKFKMDEKVNLDDETLEDFKKNEWSKVASENSVAITNLLQIGKGMREMKMKYHNTEASKATAADIYKKTIENLEVALQSHVEKMIEAVGKAHPSQNPEVVSPLAEVGGAGQNATGPGAGQN